MWVLVKRSLQRQRSMAGAQFGRSRRASVQRMHSEIVEAFLRAGQQAKQNNTILLSSVERVSVEEQRGMKTGIWRAVSNLGFAIAMAIRLLNPYVLISAAFGSHRSLLAHLSARVDSMRAVLSMRTGRRRRLTAWIQDTLPQRHVPEAATAVWEDGSLLCGIVETAVPGACPGYDVLSHPNTDRSATLWLGQKLTARYLGVPPVFNEDELMKPILTVSMERRLLRYLSAVRSAATRIEAERQKRLRAINGSPMMLADDRLSSDCIVLSAIGQEESMLECVARGMGLLLGVKGRRSIFYLYLNPNHPHRHVHRLMQNNSGQLGNECMDDEAGAILMQIRGPDGDFGAALISTAPRSSSSSRSSSMEILSENWCGRIPITYSTWEESVQVSFVPQSAGIHELSLLLRGGSHVPGSPFSVSVDELVRAPVEEGFERGKMERWKATSYDSGLNKFYQRSGSINSDPGLIGSLDGSLRQRKRVVSRIVDFVTEKMLLTEDGKLQRLPKCRRSGEKKRKEEEESGTERGENPLQSRKRYYTMVSPTRSRIRQSCADRDGKMTNQPEISVTDTSLLLANPMPEADNRKEISAEKVASYKKKLDLLRLSEVAENPSRTRGNPVDFRDHCHRILWLCDILLKHSPRQESLEMLNTAGDILDGKRIHPTIMEESEPEENTSNPTAEGNAILMAQRLQRNRSDFSGLNEVFKWKEGRRSLHTWARPDRGGSIVGGRLLHKGGNYRGIVVRGLNAEAITGAYAGGDESKDDGDEADTEEEERMKENLREGRPMPRKPHFSMKRRVGKSTLANRGAATESLEQITTPDAEKDSGTAETSGKDSNKHITTKNTEPISYRESKTEAKGIKGSGGDVNKGSPTHSGKTEMVPEIESKTMTSEEKKNLDEVLSRRHVSEEKASAENEEQRNERLQGSSRQDALHQHAKPAAAVVDSGMKSVKSEEEIKNPMKEEDFAALEEKASASEVKEVGKINGRQSREDSPPPFARSSARKQSPESPEGTGAEKLSVAGGSTSSKFPRVGPRGEEGVEAVGKAMEGVVEKEASEQLMEGGENREVPKEEAAEVRVEDMGKEKSERCASEDPNLFAEAKEREEEVKAKKKLSEGKKKTISSYTQMISRMLCTDSFPQESLEWFESGEKVEGELEGSMETMKDLERAGEESKRDEEPWGDIETGLGFGLEENVALGPDTVNNEDYSGSVTAVERGIGGICPDFPDPQLNQDEKEKNDTHHRKFTETAKRSGVGVGVGVGVVVAGGIISKDDNTSQERREDEGSTWWRRRDKTRAERMMELSRQASTEKHWDDISTGIDAMEDGSIASIITGVVTGEKEKVDNVEKLRRWSASEEAREDMGKENEGGKSPSKDGEEGIAGHSITGIPQEKVEGTKGAVGRPQSGRVSKEEASGTFERRGVAKGPDSVRGGGEQVRRKKESGMEPEGESIPGGEWWPLRDKIGAGAGKIEEMGGAWGGRETKAEKLGRHIPEKGIEVREWQESEYRREKRKAAFGGESTPAEGPRHKGIGGKEDFPSVSGGKSDDPLRTEERKGEKRGTTSRGASLKHEEIDRAEEAGEVLSVAENSKEKAKESVSGRKDSEGKGLKGAERENLGTKGGTETDKKERKKDMEPLSTGTEFSSESAKSENKYSLAAIKESLRDRGESNGRATKREVVGGRELKQVLVKSTKGVVLGSVTEGKCETSFQGAMELGVEKVNNLLGCLIEIPKDNAKTEKGSSPKRVGEGICSVKMSLEDWMKGTTEESDYLDPETEVIVGEYEEVKENVMGSSEKRKNFEAKREASAEIKPDDGKNWINAVDEVPLLIMEENSGKRQYNFTDDNNIRESVKQINQDSSKTGEAESMRREGKEANEREVPKKSGDPFSGFESRGKQSQPDPNTSTYPDLEELIGSDFTYKTTSCTTQFNLWPSEEAFGERKTAENVETLLNGKSPMRGVVAGMLGNVTNFSRTTIVMSNSPHLKRVFRDATDKEDEEEKGGEEKEEDKEEEEVLLVEQEFDDRSDELQTDSFRHYDFQEFDTQTHPRVNSGDAFLIFESPGVTTYIPFEMDEIEDKKEFVEEFDTILEGEDGVKMRGEWEEVTIYLDEDEESVDQNKSRIWEVTEEESGEPPKDPAFATVMEKESSPKHKVLPAGRWSARLSMMSPVMSAISEEEAEEALPEKEQGSSSLVEEKGFEEIPSGEVPLKEAEDKESAPHELPVLRIEVEDGFGETFARRRSSTPSVVNDIGETPAPDADCGAAFIVSSELAVALALGVSITQIIPTVVDHPPPLPQVEEAADAIAMVKTDSAGGVGKHKAAAMTQAVPNEKEIDSMGQNSRWLGSQAKEKAEVDAKNKVLGGGNREAYPDEITNKVASSSTANEQERGWILIDTTNVESIKEGKGEKTGEWRVESVGEVEEAAALTIAEGSKTEQRRGYGGAIKKETIPRSGKAESKEKGEEGSAFDSGVMDPIRGGMLGFRKSGRDNEATFRAKCDGNEAVKGEDSFVRRKREQGASEGMNITRGDGNDFEAKDYAGTVDRESLNAFESGLIENAERRNSEEGIRKEKIIVEERKGNRRSSGGSEGERPVTLTMGEEKKGDFPKGLEIGEGLSSGKGNYESRSPRKYPHAEGAEGGSESHSDRGRTKGASQKRDDLMVDRILELTFGERASSSSEADRMGRRESVFDDYRFDLWDKGFEIKRPKKPEENQDSTGLEYYLDVDQLLNVELEATEQEVKYISAKEIMENFSKIIESPERAPGSSSSGELSGAKGGEPLSLDDLIDMAAGIQGEKEGGFAKSRDDINLWGDDLFEDVSKSRHNAPPPQVTKRETIDDLLFGDEIPALDEEIMAMGENKPRERKKSLPKESPEIKRERDHVSESGGEAIHDMRCNESSENLSGEKRDWKQEHASAKQEREKTKREKSAERKTLQKLSESAQECFDIFKTFERSDENENLAEGRKKERLERSRSLSKTLSEEEKDAPKVFSPGAESETPNTIEKEKIGSTIYPSTSAEATSDRDIFDPGKKTKKRITPSKKEKLSSIIETGERITENAEKTNATESSVRDSSKVKDAKSAGSERMERIKPAPFVDRDAIRTASEVEGAVLNLNKTGEAKGGAGTENEMNTKETEKMAKNESERANIRKGAKLVKKGSKKGSEKSEGSRESEAEGRKDEKGLAHLERKSSSKSSSIDEYRNAVSEAYAFLDLQETQEGKIEEEGKVGKGFTKKPLSWNASVARMDSWDMLEAPIISGEGDGKVHEGTRHDEIDSSESSLSSPISETRKNNDQTESAASSNKDTSTEESVDTKTKHKHRKSKDFTPDDEEASLAKTTVASRKEYWDKRVEDGKIQSEEILDSASRRPPIKLSGIVKKARMSFERSSSAAENSDSGKSSSDSPLHKEKRTGRQTTAIQRKRESNKTIPTKTVGINREELDQSISKTSPESSSDSETAKALLEERQATMAEIPEREPSPEEISQKPVLMQKEVKDQKLQQKENETSPVEPAALISGDKKRSAVVENTEKMLSKVYTSDDEKSEKKVPSITRSKLEQEKQSSSPPENLKKAKQAREYQGVINTDTKKQVTDSSSLSEEEGKTKRAPAQKAASKSGNSVSRPSKQFSSTTNEAPTPDNETKTSETKPVRTTKKVSKETKPENVLSSSPESECKSVPQGQKQASRPGNNAGVDTPKKEPEKRNFSLNSPGKPSNPSMGKAGSRPAEVMSEDEGSFVARRRRFWDRMRTMSLDPQSVSEDFDDQSTKKSDLKQVRGMWERRTSLDKIQLTEERQRRFAGRKILPDNLANGRNWIAPVREASAERASSPANLPQENISPKEQQPRDKSISDKSVSDNKATVRKSVPSKTHTHSLPEKSPPQSSAKGEKKHLPDETKNDRKESLGDDIPPSKAVLPEKTTSKTKVSRVKKTPPKKETAASKSSEEKSAAENNAPKEKRSSLKKKTIKGDKTAEKKMETIEKEPSEKTAEKLATSPKTQVREKKSKSEKTSTLEKKGSAGKKSVTDPNRGSTVEKSASEKTSLKENKTESKSAPETNKGQKSISEKTLPQETRSKPSSESQRSAKVISPQRKGSLTPKDPWDSEEEKKAAEYALSRKRRSSVEIRVTDDEDVCVMREITVVPMFPSKSQMETYEEEDEDVRELHSLPVALDRRRKSLPPRNLSVQASSTVSNGRQRFESGKTPPQYASDEVVAKGTVKHHKKRSSEQRREVLPTLEERFDTKGNSELNPKGERPSAVPAGEFTCRAIPVHVDGEFQRAELGEESPAEEIPATSARGERGDDGRSAISRRVAKGTAPMQKKKPPPSAASSPDSESDATDLPRYFLSKPTAALRRHSTAVSTMRADLALFAKRRGSGDLGSPRKTVESKRRFSRAMEFFENIDKVTDSPSKTTQSVGEEESEVPKALGKKKKVRGTATDVETGKGSMRKSSTKRRSPLRTLGVKDSSESTPDSDKQILESQSLQPRIRSRRGSCDMIHSAPGSDVDNVGDSPQNIPQRRKKGGDPVLRSRVFGGSERQPRVSERFNVMDLFRDVAGAGTGGSGDLSGRATPLGIPHQAAVLAALRSVEDVRSAEATSPYDLYSRLEAANDCEPSPAVRPAVNANRRAEEQEGNVKFESPVTLQDKQEYKSEYPHMPNRSPRVSRHRLSPNDLIPRNVLLKLDNTQSSTMPTTSRRSHAELY